jgi:hypothetical protein
MTLFSQTADQLTAANRTVTGALAELGTNPVAVLTTL